MPNISDTLDLLRLNVAEVKAYNDHPIHDMRLTTDLAARLNALYGDLGDQNQAMKALIKSDLLGHDRTILEGHAFVAVMTQNEVTRLDMDRVKQFLGRRLPDYQITSPEIRLTFKPRG